VFSQKEHGVDCTLAALQDSQNERKELIDAGTVAFFEVAQKFRELGFERVEDEAIDWIVASGEQNLGLAFLLEGFVFESDHVVDVELGSSNLRWLRFCFCLRGKTHLE
jgi:hypothetical protein